MATNKDNNKLNEILAAQIYNNEVLIAESNQTGNNDDYESYLGILDNVRDEKSYEWQSDIRIPEFVSHSLAQSAIDVGQYFGTRDFVECKINDPSDQAKNAADASKELINRTLNKRELYHYLKFVRGKSICNLVGKVYLKCWWEQEFVEQQTGWTLEQKELDVDIQGNPITENWQVPKIEQRRVPKIEPVAVVDRFNYDVWDQRNVFESTEYVYSLQQKEWIIFRDEATLSELEDEAEMSGYFDIDKLEKPPDVTKTKEESYQKYNTKENQSKSQTPYDRYERYGKYWIIEKNGEVKPGIDESGEVLEKATYEEVILTFVAGNGTKQLIGLEKTHFISAMGQPYKPCARGLCYVHPANDDGMGDGQNVRELQTATDDTFNAAQDKTLLSTFPTFKAAAQSTNENSTIYIAPGHTMELQDVRDVEEFKIESNTSAALNQLAYLEDKGRQVQAMNETTTGGVPSIASTTATAVSAATQSSNTRLNYKSLTFENTALLELYWMIQQMTYSFATDKTGIELMGEDKLRNFDPRLEYYFSPLSQSIETEVSKAVKRKEWMQLVQTYAQIQHPDTVKVFNFATKEIIKLMGDEYENANFLDESVPAQTGGQQGSVEDDPVSNQQGIAQSQEEIYARG